MTVKSSFFLLTLLHCVFQATLADTYYLSPDGNNANNGSKAAPWKTFVYAATQIQPGDIVRVMPGTFFENAYVKIRTDNVTFMADDPNNKPVIDFKDHDNPEGNIVEGYGCSNVTWDGIHIYNAGGKGRGAIEAAIWNATEDPQPVSGWTFKNFDIYYSYNAAIKIRHCNDVLVENVNMIECAQMNADRKNTNNHPHILLGAYADNVVVRGCKILKGHGEGVGPYIYCTNWLIENCEVADNYAINIYLDTQEGNCVVRNNLIYNTGYFVDGGQSSQVADGIRIANEISDFGGWGAYYDPSQNEIHHMQIYNNIIINCNGGIAAFPYSWDGKLGPSELHHSLIAHNSIMKTTGNKHGIRLTMPGSNNDILNNIVYQTKGMDVHQNYNLRSNFLQDPMFIVGTGFLAENYQLLGSSPCINTAETINQITFDFWNNMRPQRDDYDIGAHEHTYGLVSLLEKEDLKTAITPNPISTGQSKLIIRGNDIFGSNSVKLHDSMGRMVFNQKIVAEQIISLELSNLRPGVYMIRINDGSAKRLLVK